jgi:hypothetical protein
VNEVRGRGYLFGRSTVKPVPEREFLTLRWRALARRSVEMYRHSLLAETLLEAVEPLVLDNVLSPEVSCWRALVPPLLSLQGSNKLFG